MIPGRDGTGTEKKELLCMLGNGYQSIALEFRIIKSSRSL